MGCPCRGGRPHCPRGSPRTFRRESVNEERGGGGGDVLPRRRERAAGGGRVVVVLCQILTALLIGLKGKRSRW